MKAMKIITPKPAVCGPLHTDDANRFEDKPSQGLTLIKTSRLFRPKNNPG